jgi:hypothetical protein
MTIDEIESWLSMDRQLCLAIDQISEFPGYVRSVFLRKPDLVVVEFESYGNDEGGAYFYGRYPGIQSAIEALEGYIHKSLSEWQPVGAESYPLHSNSENPVADPGRLATAIQRNDVPLPTGTTYELRGSQYWLRFRNP